MRSATSLCTMTVAFSMNGHSWKYLRTSVAATAYGRLETHRLGRVRPQAPMPPRAESSASAAAIRSGATRRASPSTRANRSE